MALSGLLALPTEADYKQYFISNYCGGPLITWDGNPVMFYPEVFEHAFYKRLSKQWKAAKSTIDLDRCQRMLWIKDVLQDSTIILHKGYDKATGCYDNSRRVALLSQEKYVVVIRNDGKKWRFVTAYLIDNSSTYNKILRSPIWTK